MSKFYTAKDLEKMIASGTCLKTLPSDAKFTPMARDILRKHKVKPGTAAPTATAGVATGSSVKIHTPVLPDAEYNWKPGGDPKTAAELEKFFYSPEIQVLKERICHIGKRIWDKGYVDGNGGNITVRVGDNLVLCTPTLISKGFMTPDDICMVDLDGNQVAGTRPRTSEVNTHLGIMKNEPKAKSCVHAHPVYATAFAVAGVTPPSCLIPEPEVFLGEIGLASYQTPGTPENAQEVGQLAKKHQSILMQNHGVICWGKDVEDAYWKMENTDAFCQTVTVSMQIGGPKQYGTDKLKELINIRKNLGMPDHRLEELKECELCDADAYTIHTSPQPTSCGCQLPDANTGDIDEALVKQITDMIVKELSK
ncbi:class II aldolase/adducin family protein [Puniceicoccales bacterium CK1056]|uniref:Class II aldolase/adducin family protein n=1 Tax=Oceanipulchritudo coccoides TaxID=2706888 RepID=A0A6B2M425_9BACT|nr:class II aldolase/adducin family protein [Oceanipulchritudo coccoides]NDV62854.1 class II aldolase/adducin family protein [Oceanipulchritudo coccoides]